MRLCTALILGGSVLAGSLGHHSVRLHRELEEALRQRSLAEREARGIVSGMLERAQARADGAQLFAGLDQTTGALVSLDAPRSGVLYLFRVGCAFSGRNLEALERLQARGVRVVGFAPEDAPELVDRFRESQKVSFPLVVQAHGSLVELVPRARTPLTIMVVSGRIAHMWLGALTPEREGLLELLLLSTPASRR